MDWNIYNKKRIIITGHTGFKGSWLTRWLIHLGAELYGISNSIPTSPSHFQMLDSSLLKNDYRLDVRNENEIGELFKEIKPHMVFHLAAQAIVAKSYTDPIYTFSTNAIGSANVLKASFDCGSKPSVVMITSDKCYQNKEWLYGYREIDKLGGSDPYSASKASAEIMINSLYKSFNSEGLIGLKMAIARAGNVIGGGDWSSNRLIPDCIKAWSSNKEVLIRSPKSTRPWQHVLEPLGGYLILMHNLIINKPINGEAFNFGPPANQDLTVQEVVKEFSKQWGANAKYKFTSSNMKEAALLKLNCDKAKLLLDWQPVFTSKESIDMTSRWYLKYYNSKSNKVVNDETDNQIMMAQNRLSL